MPEMPDCPTINRCQCYPPESNEPCVCDTTERALRAITSGLGEQFQLSPAQREWCLQEIASVEGYERSDFETDNDVGLARGVLGAWRDYCRDKGLY